MSSVPSSSSVCSTPSAPFPRMRAIHGKSKWISRSTASEFYVSLSSDLRLLAVKPGGTAPSSLRSFRDGEAAFCLKLKRMEDFSQDSPIERVVAERVRPYGGRSVDHAVIISEGKKSVVLFTKNAEERNNWLNALRIRVAPLPVLRSHILAEISSDNPIDGFNLSVANVARGILDYDNAENEPKKSTARWAKRLWELFETGKKPIDCASGLMRALAGASKEVKSLAQPFSAIAVVGSVFSIISLTASAVLLIAEEREGRGKLADARTKLHDGSRALLEFFVKILKSGLHNELLVEEVFKVISESWDAAVNVEQYLLQRCMKRVWEAKQIKDLEEKVEAVTKQLLVVGTLNAVAKVGEDVGEVRKDVAELKDGLTDAQMRIGKVEAEKGVVDEFIPYFPDDAKLRDGLLPEASETTLSQLKSRVLPRPSQSDEAVSAEGISSVADNVVRRVAVASVSGEGGVGKTSACRLLCADPEVQKYFRGGAILWLELGLGVLDAKVMKRIASVVADCGGHRTAERIREAGDVEDAVSLARGFFSSHRIFLVIDNVWKPTADSKVKDWMTELSKIACCGGSVVVMSTRFDDLSKAPGLEHVRLGRLNLEEANSPDWKIAEALYDHHRKDRVEENCSDSYARPQKRAQMESPTEESVESYSGIRQRALKLSCGIPLAIAMIGSLIRELGRGCGGAEAVLSSIESKEGGLAAKSSGEDAFLFVGHEGIYAVMSECLNFLDECKRRHDIFRIRRGERKTDCDSQFSASYKSFSDKPMSSRYAALEAMEKSATHLTFEVLRHLWHLRSAFEAREVAQMFENVGLGRIVRHGESDDEAIFSVHDLQYAYCADVSSSFCVNGDDARASINGHLLLLSGCKSTFGRKRTEVDWASVCFFSERFCDEDELPSVPAKSVSQHLGQNLFSHLCEAYKDRSIKSADEMVRMLSDYRWVRGRGAAHGRMGVISDFMMAESVFRCGGEQEQSYVRPIHLLRRIVQLVPENAYRIVRGKVESDLAWHIAGRIHEEMLRERYSESEVEVFEKLMCSTEKNVRGPWLRARNGCFSRMSLDPRMASDILVNQKRGLGRSVRIAELGDGEHIVCVDGNSVQIRKVISTDLALHVRSGGLIDVAVANCERERSYFVFVIEFCKLRVMKVAKDNAGGLSQVGEYKFQSDKKGVVDFAISKNGHRVVGCFRKHVTYWKRKDGDDSLSYEELWRFSFPTGNIGINEEPASIAISQSGDFVVAVLGCSLLFWKEADSVEGDTSERKPTKHELGEEIYSIALSPTGPSLFVALVTGVVEVWDVASESRRDRIEVHEVSGAAASKYYMRLSFLEEPLGATGVVGDGRLFVGVNSSVMEYSAKDLRFITKYDVSSAFVSMCAFVSRKCERIIAVGCTDGAIRVLRSTGAAGDRPTVLSGKNIRDPVSTVTIAPKRDIVLAGHESGMLSMWRASTGVDFGSLETAHSDVVTCIDVSDDEEFAVSGSEDKSIRVLNLNSKKLDVVLNGHTCSVFDVRWSDNRRIVSSDESGEIRIWDGKEDGTTLTVLPADKYVRNPWLFVSQDGEYCLSVSAKNTNYFFGHLFALKDGHTITSYLGDPASKSPGEFLDEFKGLCVDIKNGFRTRSCVARGTRHVRLFLGAGTSSQLDVRNLYHGVHSSIPLAQISCYESAEDLKKYPSVRAKLNNYATCIAAAPAPTTAGSRRRFTVACCVTGSGTPAIMHYMFST